MSYSQEDEEEIILKWFGDRKGRFLDIGAWDAKTFSNTRALYERGWSGVMIDASPFPLCNLIREYKSVPDRITIVNCAVAAKEGLLKFYDSEGDGVSTTNEFHMKLWKENNKVAFFPIWVWAITPPKLLEFFPGPYDLVSIDAEGTTLEIFDAFPWSKVKAELVIVEHDGAPDMAEAAGRKVGFKSIHRNANNLILVRA